MEDDRRRQMGRPVLLVVLIALVGCVVLSISGVVSNWGNSAAFLWFGVAIACVLAFVGVYLVRRGL